MSENQESTVDVEDTMRDVMSNFAASVTVVTSRRDGRNHGLTVSAFTSVSLDPPLVLICIDRSSHSLAGLLSAEGFTVNLLRHGTGEVAMKFASKDDDKFADVATIEPVFAGAGLTLPEESFAILECRTVQTVDAGDHIVFLGYVEVARRVDPGAPLVYWRRGFAEISVD